MQIVGDQKVRIIPDIAVNGNGQGGGVVEALLCVMLRGELQKMATPVPTTNGNGNGAIHIEKP